MDKTFKEWLPIVITLFCLVAIGWQAGQARMDQVQYLDPADTASLLERAESVVELRDPSSPNYWRTMYGFDGSVDQFSDYYRTPASQAWEYGAKVPLDQLPRDREKWHVTAIYNDRYQDPASIHLANALQQHPYLRNLRDARYFHFRRFDVADAQYRSYLSQVIPEEHTPALLISEPDDGSGSSHVVYYRYGRLLPADGDALARQVDAAIRRAVADRPSRQLYGGSPQYVEASLFPSLDRLLGQCGPDQRCQPWQPQPSPTSNTPLPPWPPASSEEPPWLFLVLVLALGAGFYAVARRR